MKKTRFMEGTRAAHKKGNLPSTQLMTRPIPLLKKAVANWLPAVTWDG